MKKSQYIPLTTDKHGLWISLMFILSLTMATPVLYAQPFLFRGTEFPKNPLRNTFFHNPVTKELHFYNVESWEKYLTEVVDTVSICNQYIWLEGSEKGEILFASGIGLLRELVGHYCGDSITGYWRSGGEIVSFLDVSGRLLVIFRGIGSNWTGEVMHVQGREAFCVPAYFGSSPSFTWDEMRNWGILGTNGHWLIEPKYDGPFEFMNGVAEVTEKGISFRINEKGEIIR